MRLSARRIGFLVRPTLAAFIIAGLSAGLGTMAQADEIGIESEIDSVTVFPTGAEARRLAKVKLPAGEHVLVIDDLPAEVISGSVRVEGSATGGLRLGAVDTEVRYVIGDDAERELDAKTRKALEDEIERLSDELQSLTDRLNVAATQRSLMVNLASGGVIAKGQGLGEHPWGIEPARLGELYQLIGERMSEADGVIQATRIAQRKITERIDELRRQLESEPPREEQRTVVHVQVVALAELEADLSIRYQLQSASWQPQYEARMSTEAASGAAGLQLVRFANIQQATGEDWRNVALTLSTTQPARGTSAPDLPSLRLEFEPEQPPAPAPTAMRMRPRAGGTLSMEDAVAPEAAGYAQVGAAAPVSQPAVQIEARISSSAFQASYGIPGRTTVATSGAERRVRIDAVSPETELVRRTVPSLSPAVYLYADLTVPADVRLLEGPVSLFRDDVFVGAGWMPQLAAGAKHKLGVGIDDGITVRHNETERTAGESGTFSTSKTEINRFKITLENRHAVPVKVWVVDRVPVPGDEAIKVALKGAANKPSERDLDNLPGVIAWEIEVAAGKTGEIEFGYDLSWPADKRLVRLPGGPIQLR